MSFWDAIDYARQGVIVFAIVSVIYGSFRSHIRDGDTLNWIAIAALLHFWNR